MIRRDMTEKLIWE